VVGEAVENTARDGWKRISLKDVKRRP